MWVRPITPKRIGIPSRRDPRAAAKGRPAASPPPTHPAQGASEESSGELMQTLFEPDLGLAVLGRNDELNGSHLAGRFCLPGQRATQDTELSELAGGLPGHRDDPLETSLGSLTRDDRLTNEGQLVTGDSGPCGDARVTGVQLHRCPSEVPGIDACFQRDLLQLRER